MTEFFLDTELTETAMSYIARTCAASPYSTRELEKILFTEVWPAFLPNLLSMAGEWSGWEEQFVQERILKSYRPRFYFSWRLNPLKWYFCSSWSTVARRIAQLRNEPGRKSHDL
jgi:hypothetical protein